MPGYPPAAELQREVARAALLDGTSLYTDIFGLPELRQELARHMAADYGGAIAPEEVCITSGCNQAFAAALLALAAPGDNVIVPVPYFFNHTMWLGMQGIEARFIPAMGPQGAWPEAADAAPLIDGRTRAIVLCSPNNPTGAIYPPQAIAALFDLAREKGIALVIDETYKDFREDKAPPHGLFARPGWQETFVHLYSFSKAFSMTGYRVGSIIAGRGLLADTEKILDCMTICPPHISQLAALHALKELGWWRDEKARTMGERLSALRRAFRRPGLAYTLQSSGALFAYARHPFAGRPAKEVAKGLAGDNDLLVLPGSMFGQGQEDFLRIAFANAEAADMEILVDRLIESQG